MGLAVTIDGEVVVVVVVVIGGGGSGGGERTSTRAADHAPAHPSTLALVLALAAASQQTARTVLGQSTFLLLPCGETLEVAVLLRPRVGEQLEERVVVVLHTPRRKRLGVLQPLRHGFIRE